MRKSGLAAAAGLGSLVLLLAGCGGASGSNTAAGSPSSVPAASSAASGAAASNTGASSATAEATATKTAKGSTRSAKPHKSVAPQPSGGDQSIPPVGTTVMVVQKSAVGYVLAEANNHQVVYTYSKDKKGGKPTCTGACAEVWLPATGPPQAGPADVFPGQFGLVTGAGGVKQITYNGYPLYLLKGAKPLAVTGNGQGGVWHVVPLSASDIRV